MNLVFNVNTEDMVFYGNDWKKAAYDVYVNGAENPLPQHIATFGKCFHGWSTIFNGRDAYTSLSDDAFLMMLEQASPEEETVVNVSLDLDGSWRLRYHWTSGLSSIVP